LQQSISDKQQNVEQLKARLLELEESLKKQAPANAPVAPASENPSAEPAPENPPAPPQP